MDIRLLKIFRRRASKEICIRRQPGKRYEIVCPSEDAPLGYFFRDWVPINSQLASVTWEKVTQFITWFRNYVKDYQLDNNYPAMVYMVGYFR